MVLTKEQISELMCKHAEREHGLHDLFEIMLESMMVAEQSEYLKAAGDGNKGNGYRLGHTYGQGHKLEFRIPRDRYGNFHPQILAVLKNQEEECDRLAGALYSKGLTQSQVGDIFDEIYGEHYSKSSISRMIQYMREEVSEWLDRPLDSYYPVVFIDCVFIKVRRARCSSSEAFYVVMGVRDDKIREVLGIYYTQERVPQDGLTCCGGYGREVWIGSPVFFNRLVVLKCGGYGVEQPFTKLKHIVFIRLAEKFSH